MRALTIQRLSYPLIEPVTVAEAALQARVDADEEITNIIAPLVTRARAHVESIIDGAIISQSFKAGFAHETCGYRELILPKAPLLSVDRVYFLDDDSEEIEVASSAYTVSKSSTYGAFLRFKTRQYSTSTYHAAPLYVELTAGFADYTPDEGDTEEEAAARIVAAQAKVPPQLKQAIVMLAAHWFDNPSTVLTGTISKEVEFGVNALCAHFKTKKV